MRLSLPDVVITDMLMPEMDGMELVRSISVDYPHIPVILITGHGNESLAVEALEKGQTSYVSNSFWRTSCRRLWSRYWRWPKRTAVTRD